jgi:hypothetical protein
VNLVYDTRSNSSDLPGGILLQGMGELTEILVHWESVIVQEKQDRFRADVDSHIPLTGQTFRALHIDQIERQPEISGKIK